MMLQKASLKDGGTSIPLVVDFDGTLHRGDLMWEALAWAARHDWFLLMGALWAYIRHGRAACKMVLEDQLLGHWFPNLPWDERVLELAQKAQADGRRVVVATGSPQRLVAQVLKTYGLDVEVWGTVDPTTNMTARNKAAALVRTFGEKKFDYAGNSAADHPVWVVARKAWVVNAGGRVAKRAMAVGNHEHILPQILPRHWALLKAMRPHQWLKNLLVFVPILTAHAWAIPIVWINASMAFVAFSLCASSVYLLNDLLDIMDDREHPTKRNRPLAAGTLSVRSALLATPLLAMLSFAVAYTVSWQLVVVLAAYLILTMAYSLMLKRWPVWDVVLLAGLYCIRVVAGGAATGIDLSFWLLLLALLGFYSLANMKRYIELRGLAERKENKIKSRGYNLADATLVMAQGTASGLMAVMIIGLYIQSPAVVGMYSHPTWVGLICPLALWWLGRAWFKAHRDTMDDDPVVFAAKDPVSWLAALAAVAVMVAAL